MTARAASDSHASRLFDIEGRGAVVTGAASGLGFAYVRVLARNGARVIMVDVAPDTLEASVAELQHEGLDVRGAVADVRDRSELDSVMEEAAGWASGLDIVFANAGISSGRGRFFGQGLLDEVDEDRWQQVIDINLTGVLNTVRAAAPRMNDDAGRIIVTSSVAGHRADPLVGYAYSASKAAVSHLARNLAGELAPRGINVNVIAPGSFLTPIGRNNPGNEVMLEELRRATAVGRLAEPEEIEGLALLLASPAARHITGAVYTIDGGVLVQQN